VFPDWEAQAEVMAAVTSALNKVVAVVAALETVQPPE
jgi:hypothetical protein